MQQNHQLRVLQLGSPTSLYGAERWILALVKHLDAARIESIVSVIKDDADIGAPICREAEAAGYRTKIFYAFGKVNFSAVRQIRDYVKKEGIHILHTHGYKSDIVGRLATAGTTCRIVSTPHGWSKEAGIKIQVYELTDRLVFPFFDAVVPLSAEIHFGLKRIPGLNRKLHLILNGVDVSEIEATIELSMEQQALRANGNVVLGYIGQLIPRKGLDTLMRAFSRLDGHKFQLSLVGDGPLRSELEALAEKLKIRDRVTFYGFREDRIALLKGFDLFVLPSRLEGVPRCLMEAMAASVPIVASNISGCQKLLQDRHSGLLFEVNDAGDLRAKIEEVVRAPAFASMLARNAKERVYANFSASQMGAHYASLYAQLVAA